MPFTRYRVRAGLCIARSARQSHCGTLARQQQCASGPLTDRQFAVPIHLDRPTRAAGSKAWNDFHEKVPSSQEVRRARG